MLYFAGRTGWPDTYKKKIDEMTTGGLPLSWNGRITQNSFGNERGNLKSTRLALTKWKTESAAAGKREIFPGWTISSQIHKLSSNPGVCS